MSGHDERGILHYVQSWLEPSEPFVAAQISRSSFPTAVVAALGRVGGTDPPGPRPWSLALLHRMTAPGALQRRARTAVLSLIAAREQSGLVHVHFGYRLPDVVGLVTRRRLPLVVSLHGHDVTALLATNPGHYHHSIDRVDAVIVPSEFFASVVVDRLGVDRGRIRVIPSGVEIDRFRPSPLPPDPVVVFVGRFVEKKGLDVLLRAWESVQDRVPGARLRLVGYGPLVHVATSAGPSVEVVLDPPRDSISDHLAAARVVVSPSRTSADGDVETLLVVNLEAQASGRPVVTTRHGGIPEYVRDGETAVVVPEADPVALADALVQILTDDAVAERLAAAGPRWASRFTAERTARSVDRLYAELMSGG